MKTIDIGRTFKCDICGKTYKTSASDGKIDLEASNVWALEDASKESGYFLMVCDNCFKQGR